MKHNNIFADLRQAFPISDCKLNVPVMKATIIYNSKYGATRQYAEWLGKELHLPAIPSGNITKKQMDYSDILLIGTPVYYGKFRIKKWLKKNIRDLYNKKIFFFIINATVPGEQVKRERFVQHNVPGEIRQRCEIYFLPGRLIYKSLTFFDKLILKMTSKSLKDPKNKKAIISDLNEVKKENLKSLIEAVNKFLPVILHIS